MLGCCENGILGGSAKSPFQREHRLPLQAQKSDTCLFLKWHSLLWSSISPALKQQDWQRELYCNCSELQVPRMMLGDQQRAYLWGLCLCLKGFWVRSETQKEAQFATHGQLCSPFKKLRNPSKCSLGLPRDVFLCERENWYMPSAGIFYLKWTWLFKM